MNGRESMSRTMTIYCNYDEYGWVASSSHGHSTTRHHPGPLAAAKEIADSEFGKYSIRRSHKNTYNVVELTPLSH